MCDPTDGSPPGFVIPGILQARTLEWVAISFSNAWKWKVKVKSFSRVWLFTTPWTAAYQAPPSMGFSRQEYWSGLALPSLKMKGGVAKCLQGPTTYVTWLVFGCVLVGSGGTQICALVPKSKGKTWVQPACQYRRHKRCGFWSLGWEGSLKKKMATHSSILAWRIPWTEEPVQLQSIELQSNCRVRHDWGDLAQHNHDISKYFKKYIYLFIWLHQVLVAA